MRQVKDLAALGRLRSLSVALDENISMSNKAYVSMTDYRAVILFIGYHISQQKCPVSIIVVLFCFFLVIQEGREGSFSI